MDLSALMGPNHTQSSNGPQRDARCSSKGSSRSNNSNRHYLPKCQICDQLVNINNALSYILMMPPLTMPQHLVKEKKTWLLDSAASYNITGDLANLYIHYEYDAPNEIILGDGSSLNISHISSLALHSLQCTLSCMIPFIFLT